MATLHTQRAAQHLALHHRIQAIRNIHSTEWTAGNQTAGRPPVGRETQQPYLRLGYVFYLTAAAIWRDHVSLLTGQRIITMKTLVDHLAQYAQYHRDRRNIFSHFIGIPMIVLAVAVLLSRPGVELLGLWLSPALLVAIASCSFYLRLDWRFGLLMSLLLGLSLWAGAQLAQQSTLSWLLGGIGLFVLGWIIQFIGHYYEGRKPAFIDDITGLIIGPLFVVAELGFLLGLRTEVQHAIEERAGPTCLRQRKVTAG